MARWRVLAVCAALAATVGVMLPVAEATAGYAPRGDSPFDTFSSVEASASPAHKRGPDNTTPSWANNSMTGYCGQVDGGYPVAAQLFLYAAGTYAGPIDNYWGSNSHTALINYQRTHGNLQTDGCAGPKTWADMQARVTPIGQSTECNGFGYLNAFRYQPGARWAYFDQSTQSQYWYADVSLQPRGGPIGEHLYRFSDDLHAYC